MVEPYAIKPRDDIITSTKNSQSYPKLLTKKLAVFKGF